MDRKELEAKVLEMVAACYKKELADLSVDTVFKDLGGASTQMVALVSEIENELDASVQLAEASACTTVADLVNLVEDEL